MSQTHKQIRVAGTRQRLSDYHSFLALAYAIGDNHSRHSDEFRKLLNTVSDFLRTASIREIHERGKALEKILIQTTKIYDAILPRKKNVREIARDFRLLSNAEQDIWRIGIPNGWLQERFDTSLLRQIQDLPRHARIGIGAHAGNVSVEESSLLSDAFFLLVNARDSIDMLMRSARRYGIETNPHKHTDGYCTLSSLNKAACTYSRLGLITAAAFVETFVNSVGCHEAAVRSDLTEQERSELLGMRKGRYISLEAKLERIPRILRKDKKSPIVISDEKQMCEPFISFLRETKQVRDASMHFAPGKAPIVLSPQEWLKLVESAVQNAVSVAREFWAACYPGRPQPRYLAGLDYDGLLQEALDRLTRVKSELSVAKRKYHPRNGK